MWYTISGLQAYFDNQLKATQTRDSNAFFMKSDSKSRAGVAYDYDTGMWPLKHIFNVKLFFHFSSDQFYFFNRRSGLQISTHSDIGKFRFDNIKYIHPGRTHLDPNQGLGCYCFWDRIQFYANKVFNLEQATENMDIGLAF